MQIEEYFVSYELAKELKEIGCDLPSVSIYGIDSKILYNVNPKDWNEESHKHNFIKAPLHDQVFDWLEEEHGFELQCGKMSKQHGVLLWHMEYKTTVIFNESKREAKEAAIKQAVELIKKR